MAGCQEMLENAPLFSPFLAQFFLFLQNCLFHIQSSISGQSYTKNQKNLWTGCRDVLKNTYFSHLFRHFRPKRNFSCKTAYAIFKVVYQASLMPKIRKIMDWLPRRGQKRIFFTPFSPFSAQIFFLSCKTAYAIAIFKVVYQSRLVTYQKS